MSAPVGVALFWFVLILLGMRAGIVTPKGISFVLGCAVIIGGVLLAGLQFWFIAGGSILVISALVFMALVFGKPGSDMNNGNDKPCDPNWKPAAWPPKETK